MLHQPITAATCACPSCEGIGEASYDWIDGSKSSDCMVCDGHGNVTLAEIAAWAKRNRRDAWMVEAVEEALGEIAIPDLPMKAACKLVELSA